MCVVKKAPAHARDTVLAIDRLVGFDRPGRQGRGHRERFHGRARLEAVNDGSVAAVRRRVFGRLVRVERGIVRKREDLPGRGIHHHDASAARLERAHAQRELSLCDVLNRFVDREHHALPLHRPVILHVVREDDMAATVADRFHASIRTAKSILVGELDAFDASSIDVRKAQQMRREVAVRVVATCLGRQLEARDVELANACSLVRRDTAFDPNEVAIGCQSLCQPLRIDVENLGDTLRDGSGVLLHRFEAPGIRVHAVDVRADCQLGAVPVVNRPSTGRHPKLPKVLVLGHFTQAIPGCDLKVEGANDDSHRDAHHARAEQRDPRSKPTLPTILHRTLPAAVRLRLSVMVTMRVGLGTSIPRVPRAMVSMRPLCRSVAASIESRRRS